ncbi:MAG: cation diffusion facilitator family transporter, partial [bacterium]
KAQRHKGKNKKNLKKLCVSIRLCLNMLVLTNTITWKKLSWSSIYSILHMLTDALISLGIVVLGLIWLYKPWYWLDPIISWTIVIIILYNGWIILREAFIILTNATPENIDLEAIRREIESINGIKGIHHLHVWNLSPNVIALDVHIIVPDQMLSEVDELAIQVRKVLLCKLNIIHPVLQFETKPYDSEDLLCPR